MSIKSIWIPCFLLVLMTFSPPSRGLAAGPYFVKADAAGANNGTSWANAFTDLQNALAAAEWGEEIWVAAGTYKPTNGTDRNKSFVLVAGVGLYGGFAGTETAREQRDWAAHETILSGDIGVQGNISDNSYHVVAGGFNAVLDGFTVKGGNAGGYSYSYGGGMINDSVSPIVTNCTFSGNTATNGGGMYNYSSSSPTVTNCTFSGNTASGSYGGYGGGMYNSGGSTTVTNCTFSGNTANYGGGMYNSGSSTAVTNCTFSGNMANSQAGGGGMYNTGSSPILTNCTFSGNSAGSYYGSGGGMYNVGSSPILTNCTFSGNSAGSGDGVGGGMCNQSGSPKVTNCTFSGNTADDGGGMFGGSTTVTNCTFSGNTASSYGGGMYNGGDPSTVTNCTFSSNTANYGGGMCNSVSPKVTNCILWENSATLGPEVYKSSNTTPTFRNCDIRGSGGSGPQWNPALGTDGGGNIMGDPRFVDAVNPAGADGIWMTADDGLRLQADSPCINKGYSNGAPATDILGNPRSGLPDIGAYEFQGGNVALAPIGDAIIRDDQAYTGPTPVLIEGLPPITWSLVQGPTGMTINPATGVVSWPAPTTTGSPFTIKIRATNAFTQADATWTLTVYHPGPPSTPAGGLEITYHVTTPSVSPDGQPVNYTYVWTSDGGDRVTHGPTLATSDTLTEMNLVQDGETWTVTVTPRSGTNTGTAASASVKFVDIRSGVMIWSFYK